MLIIPAIDIIDGKCVRLTQGDYDQKKVYNEHPLEVAKAFEGAGITHLHLVDLDGARASHIVNYKVLEKIATKTSLSIDFGGGLKSDQDVYIAFESGANQITGGTVAVKNSEIFTKWIEHYSGEKIILGADVKDRKIAVQGWEETSELDLFDFVSDYQKKGIQSIICTDIAKDGMLEGTAVELYKELIDRFSDLKIIASGGVSNIADLEKLAAIGCYGAIVGKAIYEGKIQLENLPIF